MFRKASGLTLVVWAVSLLCALQAFAGMGRFIDDNDTVVLQRNTHPLARLGARAGYAPTSLPMEHMIMSLQVPAGKQAALAAFLKDLHNPASADYHRWLTPDEFGAQFGPSVEDVSAVTAWLSSHGFQVESVAKSRTWINFSGDVSRVERTFKTNIAMIRVGDKTYNANESDPSIPRGLSDLVSGIVSLHNIPRRTKHNGAKPFASNDAVPNYTSGSSHYLAPGDFAAIYNLNPLYSAGLDGTGQSIAIVGRTHPASTNWSSFRSKMGLPANAPQVIVNGPDPGDLGSGEDTEANLDVEWSGAVAKNATVKFVTSKSTNSTDGVDLSAQYIVANNLAPVMSLSFGSCESDMGASENAFYNNLWSQAAAQGITVLVSTGDSGAAGCSDPSGATGSGKGVNGLASTPFNVAVGGTQFSEGGGTYWNSVNSSSDTSALGYIPEVAWNESGSVTGGSGLWATGGGVSQVYVKPTWQTAPGVPQDGRRDLPDVALSAAGHDSYLIVTGGTLSSVGGTSAAAPSFAGLMALLVQKTGQRQGNVNARLYQLASSQYASGGTSVFHDVVSGNNSVPGVTGFAGAAGYDLATGLGSVDANALLNNWSATSVALADFSLSATTPAALLQGSTGSVKLTTAGSGGFNSAVAFSVSGLPAGVTGSFAPTSIAAPGTGSATLTLNLAAGAAVGTSYLTVTATAGAISHSVQVPIVIQASTVYSSSFNDTWYAASVAGSAGKWSLASSGTNPTAAPHSGTVMAQFNSYTAPSGNQMRVYSGTKVAVPGAAKSATLSFWFFHDLNRPANNDRLQPQVSLNGSSWANVGASVSRYNGTSGWSQVSVDISAYIGQSLQVGALATSAAGYNMYIDDVAVTVK